MLELDRQYARLRRKLQPAPISPLRQCSVCRGATFVRIPVPGTEHCTERPCQQHLQHTYTKRCWLCRGSGRCDVLTLVWRRVVEWFKDGDR
jgi:hypothetical protein